MSGAQNSRKFRTCVLTLADCADASIASRAHGTTSISLLFLFLFVCFVLFCFVLFCFVLFCFVLFCDMAVNSEVCEGDDKGGRQVSSLRVH